MLPNAKHQGAAVLHRALHLLTQFPDSGSENSREFKSQNFNCDQNNPIYSVKKPPVGVKQEIYIQFKGFTSSVKGTSGL